MDSESIVSQVQRKVELQSPDDLSYLITNVRNAAAARLNEAFPHVEGQAGEDELRNQIEALVNEYIDKTFTLAAPNLSINGLPVPPSSIQQKDPSAAPETHYEPFNTRKRQHVADLVTQEEKLLEEVAALKRSVPSKAAADHAEVLREGLRRDDEMLRERGERIADGEGVGDGRLHGVEVLERQEGVEEEFRGAVEVLGRLKRDMSAVVAKMERARVAGEYVVSQGQ